MLFPYLNKIFPFPLIGSNLRGCFFFINEFSVDIKGLLFSELTFLLTEESFPN